MSFFGRREKPRKVVHRPSWKAIAIEEKARVVALHDELMAALKRIHELEAEHKVTDFEEVGRMRGLPEEPTSPPEPRVYATGCPGCGAVDADSCICAICPKCGKRVGLGEDRLCEDCEEE